MRQRNGFRKHPVSFPRAILFSSIAVLLAGCNSGGSGAASTPSPATAVAITQQNSTQVSGAAYQSVSQTASSSTTGSSILVGAVTTSGAAGLGLARFAEQQLSTLASLGYVTGANLAAAAVISRTVSCSPPPSGGSAGSMGISFNDADNSGTLTTGDTLSATFTNCYDATDRQTIKGGFSLSALTLKGTPGTVGMPWQTSATFSFKDLSITEASGAYTVNGEFSFSADTADGVTVDMSLNGTSLSVQKVSGPTLTLENFNLTETVNSNTTQYSEYATGRVIDSALTGYVNFEIPTAAPFTGLGVQYPSSGSMTITGANNSSVKLTAIDSTRVRLQVDANGNGVVNYTVTKPWASLAP